MLSACLLIALAMRQSYTVFTVIKLFVTLLSLIGSMFGVGQSDVLVWQHGTQYDVRLNLSNGVIGMDNQGIFVCHFAISATPEDDDNCIEQVSPKDGDLYTIATILCNVSQDGKTDNCKTLTQAWSAYFDYAKTHAAVEFDE